MRGNNIEYDENLTPKKRSLWKMVLIFMMIVFLCAFGFGSYYLIKNGNNIDWKALFEKKGPKIDANGRTIIDGDGGSTTNEVGSTKDNKLSLPTMDEKTIGKDTYVITINNLNADDKGYTFDVELTAIDTSYNLNCEKVLIDGYDFMVSFNISAPMGTSKKETIRINKTDLDALDINSFSNLRFYWYISNETKTDFKNEVVNVTQKISSDNTRKGLINIDQISIDKSQKFNISYYQMVEDKEATYIYFDLKNNSNVKNVDVLVKKLIVNDKLYDVSSFSESMYMNSERIVGITIPKSEFSKVESFNISFFVIVKENNTISEMYTSNEYTRKV